MHGVTSLQYKHIITQMFKFNHKVAKKQGMEVVTADQCMYGLMSQGEGGAIKEANEVYDELHLHGGGTEQRVRWVALTPIVTWRWKSKYGSSVSGWSLQHDAPSTE